MISSIMPTAGNYGFETDGYRAWCGSAVVGEDVRYHMFSARRSKEFPFFKAYVVSSEIVRASSDTPYDINVKTCVEVRAACI